MNKKEVEGIEKVIKEYLKKNLRMESRVRYLDAYSQPENYLDVCHKDNVPTNNSVNNLYWGTQKDNMSQASKDGRMIQAKGKDSVHYKGTEIQRSYYTQVN